LNKPAINCALSQFSQSWTRLGRCNDGGIETIHSVAQMVMPPDLAGWSMAKLRIRT
jgi:hypothetical protein